MNKTIRSRIVHAHTLHENIFTENPIIAAIINRAERAEYGIDSCKFYPVQEQTRLRRHCIGVVHDRDVHARAPDAHRRRELDESQRWVAIVHYREKTVDGVNVDLNLGHRIRAAVSNELEHGRIERRLHVGGERIRRVEVQQRVRAGEQVRHRGGVVAAYRRQFECVSAEKKRAREEGVLASESVACSY